MTAAYTPGHDDSVTDFMARRTADSHAAFLLGRLPATARVLDLGCGPGTITCDLAARVPRGSVLGVDMNAGQVERARSLARQRGLSNAIFEVMSLGALRVPRRSFDVVFAHAVFEHLDSPVEALETLAETLKPGGIIALRSPEWGGLVVHPETPGIARALADYEALQMGNGGDLRAGRKLAGWLAASGFVAIETSASYQLYTPVDVITEYLAARLDRAGNRVAADALRVWAAVPGAMFAQAWFEAIAQRP